MMRKKLTTLLLLVATLNMNAKEDAMYIIGSYPFGGWDPANPIKMTKVGDIYTATVTIDCDVWFMFCSDYGDWDTVELTSFGPVDSDEQIRPNCGWNSTELNLMLYSYSMTGYGDFVFEFDKDSCTLTL